MGRHVSDIPLVALSRLRPVLRVLAALAAALVAANLLLLLLFGSAPAPLRRAEVLDPGEYERLGEQIAAAERDLADSRRSDQRPLAVVLGLSTAREDIDGAALGQRLCGGMRVLNLGSSGGSYRELAFYLRTLRTARLHAGITVLAVHPVWMAGRVAAPAAAFDGGGGASAGIVGSPDLARELAARWVWLYANRRGMHAVMLDALRGARERLDDAFGLDMPARFPDGDGDPWAPRIAYRDQRGPPAFLDEQLRAWRAYGWFDAAGFSTTGEEAASLREVLSEASALGDRLVIVLLPEHSVMRAGVPAAAERSFRAVAERAVPSPIVDLRDRLPDRLFYDYAHVNGAGRARLTALMGALVSSSAGCSAGSPARPGGATN